MNQDPKVKEARRYIDHELIAEIFGFVPSEVTDDIYNLANIVFYRFMEGIAQRLIELRPDKQRAINSVRQSSR
jgi:RNase P/RNase MRP subunit POP5